METAAFIIAIIALLVAILRKPKCDCTDISDEVNENSKDIRIMQSTLDNYELKPKK